MFSVHVLSPCAQHEFDVVQYGAIASESLSMHHAAALGPYEQRRCQVHAENLRNRPVVYRSVYL